MEKITMTNSQRIEQATRNFVGATLSGEEIAHLVKKAFPDNTAGIYPSDCAYTKTSAGFVPRGKSAYGDGVLQYMGSDQFKVLPTDAIVRKPTSGRGRGTSVPRTDEDIQKSLAAKLAALNVPKGKGKDGAASV
jgi:hypothetical protein